MKKTCLIVLSLVAVCAAAHAQRVRVTGADTALEQLVRSGQLVTVVFRDRDARDSNLEVIEVTNDHVVFVNEQGDRWPYLRASIREIIVQDEVVDVHLSHLTRAILRREHDRIVQDAIRRARDIFEASQQDQQIRMQAAGVLAVAGEEDGVRYLTQLAVSNDVTTAIQARTYLYLAGDDSPATQLILDGLDSGSRATNGFAAQLAGLLGEEAALPVLREMVQDRMPEYRVPAAYALARLGDRTMLPSLFRMLRSLDDQSGRAAVFALSKLGGQEVREHLLNQLDEYTRLARFRVIQVLYNLGVPEGGRLVREEAMNIPTIAPDAAMMLARDGDRQGIDFLRERLARRMDETVANLLFEAHASTALILGNYTAAISNLQDLLRSDDERIMVTVCRLLAEIGEARFIALLQPAIQHRETVVALAACETAVSLAYPEYGERLTDIRK